MAVQDVWNRLRQFDAYPKTLEDFRVKTFGGAAVTIVSSIIMITLFISELNFYLTKEVIPELYVDATRGEKLKINMEIVFPKMACAYLSIDAMDISGEQQLDVDHNIFKRRIDKTGTPISEAEKEELGKKEEEESEKKEEDQKEEKKEVLDPNRCESCYGAETADLKCCNDCEAVQEAYRRKGWAFSDPSNIEQCKREGFAEKMQSQKEEGCEVFGYLEVNKFNMTHHVKTLSFGMEYPGMENPLDNTKIIDVKGSSMFQYFVKIVPTTYTKLDQSITRTNQYSVTKHEKQVTTSFSTGEHGLPGVFVLYELSPLMVKFKEVNRSFMHFLTGVCAIIGGVFTVAGLIDSMIYHSAKAIQKKIELGKAL
ncbi:endoplasmic reticulum-Golgi intermediate compartment protein 3-like isoform X1 [Lytechinus variegatus]|uniref:endoplasmic reticulum-Golgi intermediate compartment protein 3-like isoform X1 n=1 Tax=Lytechinus variegatus TaxID=7654 RepID=UPI001BB12E6A|nr:endoplasmic reticulum-Golgi intermediate compartment protein 3-like isoform X1 [Lytechinus variegatus]